MDSHELFEKIKVMKCSKCHETDHASDAIFCHMCGERLKRTNPLAIILPILGVLSFILILIWLFNSSSSQSHVNPGYVVLEEPVVVDDDYDDLNYNHTDNTEVGSNQTVVIDDDYDDLNNNHTNYNEVGSNQTNVTRIIINGEDVGDEYVSSGNSVVIIDNNLCFTNNNSVNRVFAITNRYTQLNIENAFDVYVCDTASRITITCNENAMPEVVEAEGGNKLIIRNKSTNTNGLSQVTIPYNPNLTNIRISGASMFNSNHALKGRSIKIDLSGSSNLNCNIEANELNLHLEGSSKANLSGRVGIINLNLGGSSNLASRMVGNGYALICDNCNGSMSGSSDAYFHCDGNINVSLIGASNLYYSGNAIISGSSTSGSSEIIPY